MQVVLAQARNDQTARSQGTRSSLGRLFITVRSIFKCRDLGFHSKPFEKDSRVFRKMDPPVVVHQSNILVEGDKDSSGGALAREKMERFQLEFAN